MSGKLTPARRRALTWLEEQRKGDIEKYGYPHGRTPSMLADYMWPTSAKRRSNSGGYGSQAGVGVNLKAGAWLHQMREEGLVQQFTGGGWLTTVKARELLA